MSYHANPEKWVNEANESLSKKMALLEAENKTLRNELCLKCGLYREAHAGACNGCRWRDK